MNHSIEAQKRMIEEKKRELLLKTSNQNKGNQLQHAASSAPVMAGPSGPSLFMNDGNFLARFQAMQNQKQSAQPDKPSNPETVQGSNENSGKVTIKLSSAKKKEQPKLLAPTSSITSSAFEKPASWSVFTADEESSIKMKEENYSDDQHSWQTSTQRSDSRFRQTPNTSEAASSELSSLLGKRKRKNRWDEKSADEQTSSTAVNAEPSSSFSSSSAVDSSPGQSSSSTGGPVDIMADFRRAKALIQQKAVQAKSALAAENLERQRQIDEQRAIQAMYEEVIQQQAAAAKKNGRRREDKPRYEYDSDEEIEGGTWEHKKRLKEMEKTYKEAERLTEMSKGKHHMSDFLPKDELARFEEKVRAIKEGRKADLSDYAEFKIKEDNIGFKMLQKAGWQEGKGLGSEGKGITEPINKGQTSLDNSGVGVEKPHEVERDDDEFDIYRKRMMLAYRFRPNPLNNPRRPYY